MNIYNPTNEDFISWIKSKEVKWPTSDWDYCITSSEEKDNLIFQFANDANSSKRDFCIHCLYYLVGEFFNDSLFLKKNMADSLKNKVEKYKNRIIILMNMVNNNSSEEVLKWKEVTLDLLNGKIEFNPQFWFNYMFDNAS